MNYETDLRPLRSTAGDAARQCATTKSEKPSKHQLTARQIEVLGLAAAGLDNKQIATELGITQRTAEHHMADIIEAMDVPNRTAAAVTAVRNGWIRPAPTNGWAAGERSEERRPAMAEGQITDAGPVERPQFAWSSRAALDVAAERRLQIEAEGWTPEHDDEHDYGELARAAAAYALLAAAAASEHAGIITSLQASARGVWPWNWTWFKSTDARRDLVKAGALILAEIERLDRRETPNV